jgi:hypothetical protein
MERLGHFLELEMVLAEKLDIEPHQLINAAYVDLLARRDVDWIPPSISLSAAAIRPCLA